MTDHTHNWIIKQLGWANEHGDSFLKVKPGETFYAHNRYYCYGCNTAAIGHKERKLWDEDNGEEITL